MILNIPDRLTKEEIKKFKDVYKRIYNQEFTDEEVEKEALSLIRFIAIVINKN